MSAKLGWKKNRPPPGPPTSRYLQPREQQLRDDSEESRDGGL